MEKMITVQRFLLIIICLMLAGIICSCNADDYSFLEDRAGILTEIEKEKIIGYNHVLLSELDIHFKLIILELAAEDINEMAAEIFGELGSETQGGKGLLYLVDPTGRQVRIEVSYGLEQVFTDGFTGFVEEKQMVPFFELGKVGTGVLAATELFVSRLMNAEDGENLDSGNDFIEYDYYSGGGGASTDVVVGSKKSLEKPTSNIPFSAQPSPERALAEYKRVLQLHEKDPNLALFTPETRTFFRQWVVTDAQQDNELRAMERQPFEKVIISGDRAVIRFPVGERAQSPYFLKKSFEGWMLDFWTMTNVIRMNHKNMWFFSKRKHPYMFGFSDCYLDKNGFVHVKKSE